MATFRDEGRATPVSTDSPVPFAGKATARGSRIGATPALPDPLASPAGYIGAPPVFGVLGAIAKPGNGFSTADDKPALKFAVAFPPRPLVADTTTWVPAPADTRTAVGTTGSEAPAFRPEAGTPEGSGDCVDAID
jgi:hypothetical protein